MLDHAWNNFNKKPIIIEQLQRYQIQIATLSETCMYDYLVKLVNDYTIIDSGLRSKK